MSLATPNIGVEDTSIAPLIIGIGLTLQLITASLVSARIYARLRAGKPLQMHDWAVLVAEAISVPQLILIISAITHGYGRSQFFVSPDNISAAMHSVFVAQVLFSFSVTASKLAIALLLLSLLQRSRPWRLFLYGMIALLFAAFILITLLQFVACLPISAYWDPQVRIRAQCWKVSEIAGTVVTFGCVQAFTDIVFSIIPLTFIIHLHRPLREKIAIALLMGLGVFASATSVARTALGVLPKPDFFQSDALVSLLALVDLHVGIAVATVPTLRSFFGGLLVRVGDMTIPEEGERSTRRVFVDLGLLDSMYDQDESAKGVV